MIPKSFIQDLLNRLDIVDVIERYLPLKKAGANYVACCPFHNEKSPSFTVSQSKQFYHCFGCGAHGTAIGFVMEHLGVGYVEAIEELARGVGLEVPRERATSDVTHRIAPDLYEVTQTATRYYREQLKQSSGAIDYLKRRGLSGEVAAKFGIGYAPEGWQSLAAVFPNYESDALSETGLVITNDEGKRYDRFRDRIMFPIVNVRGQVIGFGGRVLDRGEPKYLNSPETTLFDKGHELYGLFQAQKAIRARECVVVVEGYMDVVALAQHGVEYAVATLGTATTPHHVQKLLRLSRQVVFCFDGDKAGQKAAWRALENALPHLVDGKRVGFLFLPEDHDPDSYIREYGAGAFEEALEDSLPLSGYLLRELTAPLDLQTQEGRNALLQKAQPLLSAIVAPTTGLLLRKEVASLAGISQAELEALYQIKPVIARRAVPQKVARTAPSAHRLLLQCLLAQPDLARQMPGDWHEEGVEAAAIADLLLILRETDCEISGAALTQMFQGTRHEKSIAAAETGMLAWSEAFDVSAEFAGLLGMMDENRRRADFAALQNKLANGGIAALTESERLRYVELTQRRR
ncbi:MAG: DNA primase [Pseudomonadota bacterium]